MRQDTTINRLPLVSVVIPAHDEAQYISDCIESVWNAGYPRDRLEVLVIDHASTDATPDLAVQAGASVLSLTTGRIGKVRNTGLMTARGEYVAYVDADCLVPDTWLSSAIAILQKNPLIGAVGGPCLSPEGGTWIETGLAPCAVDCGVTRPSTTLATSSFIARTSLLREIGGFDERLISGEDDDMSNRIRQRGFALSWSSDCHIIHRGYPQTWQDLIKKEIWHGSNHIEVRSGLDLTLMLALVFIVAIFSLCAFAPYALLRPGPLTIGGLVATAILVSAPPLLYAMKRISQRPRDWPFFAHFIGVGFGYFLGHGIGILGNGWRRLRQEP